MITFWAQSSLAAVLMRRGELVEARARREKALEKLGAIGNQRMLGTVRLGMAELELVDGRSEAALRECEQACRELEGYPPLIAWANAISARASLRLGRLEAAGQLASAAMTCLERLGTLEEGEMVVRLSYAEWLRAAGRTREARQSAAEACEIIRRRADELPDDDRRRAFLEAIIEHRELQRLAATD